MKSMDRVRWLGAAIACMAAFSGAPQATAQSAAAAAAGRDDAAVPGQPGPGAQDAAAAAPGLRAWQPRLRDLGMSNALRLRGVDSEGSLSVGIRRDEMVAAARLRLKYTLSPALLPELSHLKVLLNDQVVQTLALPKERLGRQQTAELEIDPAYFVDYNQLRLQFIGHYTLECEEPEHSSLWAEISPESVLELSLRRLPLRAELDVLPAPFFDERDNRPVEVPMVYPSRPTPGQLKAAGAVAGWLGALAGYRGNSFPAFENELPPRDAIVVATNASRPDFLRDLPPVELPTLQMMEHPSQPGALLLLVLGRDDEQVQRAADALALRKAALSGQSMRVRELEYPPLRKAYDAPRWLSTERVMSLGELVSRPEQLQLRGSVLHDAVRINARMAPDLFTWNAKGVPLTLQYQYTPTVVSERGSLTVSVNDQFLRSYPLMSSGSGRIEGGTVVVPVGDEDIRQARSELRIPAFMVGSENQLQFAFQIPSTGAGRCRSIQPVELRAALDPQSTLDLTAFHHYIAMPNMAAFANSGFPFTRFADLSQTSVLLPGQPTRAEVQLYLTVLARMAAATGYPGTRYQLLQPAQIEQAGDTDILLISEGDRDGLLQRWSADLPALLTAGKRSVQPLERSLNSFAELFRSREGSAAIVPGGWTLLEGDGPLAAVTGMQSPLRAGRSVVALTASDAASLDLIGSSLNDSGKVQLVHGDLALLRGDAVESFRIKAPYHVGDLPWWKRLWFQLHGHPFALALAGVVAGLLLTLLAYVVLQALARRRLEAGDA